MRPGHILSDVARFTQTGDWCTHQNARFLFKINPAARWTECQRHYGQISLAHGVGSSRQGGMWVGGSQAHRALGATMVPPGSGPGWKLPPTTSPVGLFSFFLMNMPPSSAAEGRMAEADDYLQKGFMHWATSVRVIWRVRQNLLHTLLPLACVASVFPTLAARN